MQPCRDDRSEGEGSELPLEAPPGPWAVVPPVMTGENAITSVL